MRRIMEADKGVNPPLALMQQPADGMTVLETALACGPAMVKAVLGSGAHNSPDTLRQYVTALAPGTAAVDRLLAVIEDAVEVFDGLTPSPEGAEVRTAARLAAPAERNEAVSWGPWLDHTGLRTGGVQGAEGFAGAAGEGRRGPLHE